MPYRRTRRYRRRPSRKQVRRFVWNKNVGIYIPSVYKCALRSEGCWQTGAFMQQQSSVAGSMQGEVTAVAWVQGPRQALDAVGSGSAADWMEISSRYQKYTVLATRLELTIRRGADHAPDSLAASTFQQRVPGMVIVHQCPQAMKPNFTPGTTLTCDFLTQSIAGRRAFCEMPPDKETGYITMDWSLKHDCDVKDPFDEVKEARYWALTGTSPAADECFTVCWGNNSTVAIAANGPISDGFTLFARFTYICVFKDPVEVDGNPINP